MAVPNFSHAVHYLIVNRSPCNCSKAQTMDQLDTGLISLKLDITVDQKRSVPTSCNQKRKQLLNVECGKYNAVVNTSE